MLILALALVLQEEIEQIRTKTAYVLEQGEVEVDLVASFLRFEEDGRRLDRSRLLIEVEAGVGFPFGLSEEAEVWGVIVDIEVEF